MGQSTFIWCLLYDNNSDSPSMETFEGTWDELLASPVVRDEPVAITRVDKW